MSSSAATIRSSAIDALHRSADLLSLFGGYSNYLTQPESVDLTPWTAQGGAIVTNSHLPDSQGNNTGCTVQDSSAVLIGYIEQIYASSPANGTYQASIEVAAGTSSRVMLELYSRVFGVDVFLGGAYFNLSGAGSVDSRTAHPVAYSGLASVGSGYYRLFIADHISIGNSMVVRMYPAPGGAAGDHGEPVASATGTVVATRAMLTAGSSVAIDYAAVSSWQSPAHVFSGDAGLFWGRNRGRLPFFEVWVRNQRLLRDQDSGGDMESELVVRCHVGGPTIATLLDTLSGYLTAAVKALRNYVDTNGNAGYFVEGPTAIGDAKIGAFDSTQDATLTIRHTFDRTNYTYQ